ncbi:MAG: response regulator [bacterium]
MKNITLDSMKIYDFVYNYNTQKLEIGSVDPEIKAIFEKEVIAKPTTKTDFISGLNNELFLIQTSNHHLKYEREFENEKVGLKYFSIKGSCIVHENIFRGVILDESIPFFLGHKAVQAEKLRSLGALSGGIAHDFNNQLMVISGSCELIKRHIDDPKLIAYLKNIEDATKNSCELINKLLTFGQQESVPKIVFNLSECISDTVSIITHTSNKVINMKYTTNNRELDIQGNYTLIQNAILNICKNAIEAIDVKGVLKIEVDKVYLKEIPPFITNNQVFTEGMYGVVHISDDGCGIDAIALTKIFDPFYTSKGFDKGVGLGLSTALGTMEAHQGLIGVESEIGVGTKFSLFFRLIKSENDIIEEKKRIMIIDDEYLVRMVLQDILIDLGYQVHPFESGKKALEYYSKNSKYIDLILCDMMMPEMTGKEVLNEMTKINEKIKFIILSGYSNESREDLGNNIVDYLTKPIMLNSLGEVIEKALK